MGHLVDEYVDLVLTERRASGDAGLAPLATQFASGDPESRGWLLLLALEEIIRLRVALHAANERIRAEAMEACPDQT
jgi:hypothetical protein